MSSISFDVSGLFPPPAGGAGDDSIASGTNCVVLAGYVGMCINQRGSVAGGFQNFIFWTPATSNTPSFQVASDLTANRLSFGDCGVVSSTAPTCFLTYFSSDGTPTVARLYCAIVQGGVTITGTGGSLISNDASGNSSVAITSASTAYVAFTELSTGSVKIVKSSDINGAAPSWATQGTIVAGGGQVYYVVQGSLLSLSGTLYAMTYQANSQPGPITLQKSTDDGVTWTSVGTVASSAEFGAVVPVACMKSSYVWTLLYWQLSPGSSIRLAFSRDQGATWTDVQASVDEPSTLGVYAVHASHFIAQWTFDNQISGTTTPKFMESADGGSSWQAITPTLGPPTSGDHVFFGAKLSSAAPATGGSDGGITPPEIALFVKSTATPTPPNPYPLYLAHGNWSLTEKTIDPDQPAYSSSTHALGAAYDMGRIILTPTIANGPAFDIGHLVYTTSPRTGPAFTLAHTPFASSLANGAAFTLPHLPFKASVANGAAFLAPHLAFKSSLAQGPAFNIAHLAYTASLGLGFAYTFTTDFPYTRDQLGFARILKIQTSTQLGFADIRAIVARTQLGFADIRATVRRTQDGFARILKVQSQDQLGYAFIHVGTLRLSITRTVLAGWAFTWNETVGPYQVWLDGTLLATVASPAFTFEVSGFDYEDEPPDLEIIDALGISSSKAYPPYVILQWRGMLDAWGYAVEQFIGGVWTRVATVVETARGYYAWQSGPLDDETTQAFRVRTTDLEGNTDAPLDFSFDVVRHPRHPVVSVAASSSGAIVVS